MPDDIARKRDELKILRAARELEGLGVNVLGFLEQAVDGEKRARFRARLFGVESVGVIRPNDYERRRLRHFADELRERGESSHVLFAPSFLWALAHLRHELWGGEETKARERDVREALALVADALADRRTGTHGRPKPGGAKQREQEDALLVRLLAEMAQLAVKTLRETGADPNEYGFSFVKALTKAEFWNRLDDSFAFDPEKPTSRESRLWYAKRRLNEIFDPYAGLAERSMEKQGLLPPPSPAEAKRRRERPSLSTVVAAMAEALMGERINAAIFGGDHDDRGDARVTARSLAIRALRKVCPENLQIPKR